MFTAFQSSAFQNNAFQINALGNSVTGGWERKKHDDYSYLRDKHKYRTIQNAIDEVFASNLSDDSIDDLQTQLSVLQIKPVKNNPTITRDELMALRRDIALQIHLLESQELEQFHLLVISAIC